MARTTERRNLFYRKATVYKAQGSLQSLLGRALKAVDNPSNRQEPLDPSGGTLRLINQTTNTQNMLCGNMLLYSKGAAQLLMATDATRDDDSLASSFRLEAIPAPTRGGQKTEFLESMLFFCVKNDHALFLQSRALKAESFEEHMQWLLEKSHVLKEKGAVILADQPSTNAAEAIRKSGVKSVSIGMPMIEERHHADSEGSSVERKRASRTVEVTPPIRGLLSQMLGDKLDGIRLEDALDGRIEATVELKWSYSTNEKAQQILNRLASAMRSIAKEQVSINLNNGSKVEGAELILVRSVNVHTRNKVVEQTTLFRDMREQMASLIESGSV